MFCLRDYFVDIDQINDDRLGQFLDAFHKANPQRIYSQTALSAVKLYGIKIKTLNFDTTSKVMWGLYETPEGTVGVISIDFGHSKNKRSGKKQIKFGIGCANGLPIDAQVLSGKKDDKTYNQEEITMYPMKNVKLGIAPIAWTNDDMPELGGEISFETCIDEMAESGFKGTEIGNKYPQNPTVLKSELDKRDLQVCNAWFSSFLTTKPLSDTVDAFNQQLNFLHAMGAKCIGVAEQGHSIQGLMDVPVFEQKPIFSEREWEKMIKGLNILGDLANSKGMKVAYHHHMGTGVQTAAEIERLMEETDPERVHLLYDTGHLVYSGEDHIMILKKFINRTVHVHLKDIRVETLNTVKRDKLSFLQSVKLGVFTVPGDGMIDFDPVLEELSKRDYEGWLVVEAEQDPAIANPLKYANIARAFIREKTGL